MPLTSAKDIDEVADRKAELLPVPEWNDEVYIRWISAAERDAIEALCSRRNAGIVDTETLRAKACAYFLSDAKGDRIYTGEDDWQRLQHKNGIALDRITEAGFDFNDLTRKTSKAAREAAKKDSERTAGASSSATE